MKRVGICSGKVYSEDDYNNHNIKECAICVTPSLPEEDGIRNAKERALLRRTSMACGVECFECEEAQLRAGAFD